MSSTCDCPRLAGTPPARGNASICLDPATNTLYMFGGLDTHGSPTNTLFKLDLHAMPQRNWEAVDCEAPPSPRYKVLQQAKQQQLRHHTGAAPAEVCRATCSDHALRLGTCCCCAGGATPVSSAVARCLCMVVPAVSRSQTCSAWICTRESGQRRHSLAGNLTGHSTAKSRLFGRLHCCQEGSWPHLAKNHRCLCALCPQFDSLLITAAPPWGMPCPFLQHSHVGSFCEERLTPLRH